MVSTGLEFPPPQNRWLLRASLGYGVNHEFVDGTKQKNLVQTTSLAHLRQSDFTPMDASVPTVVGAGAGVGTATVSWGAIHLVGHASTGTAMAGLHGAAAANAGWAWFGGGSLAAGGRGMAAGHFVLPGIGTAVAVAISATISHREANRVADLCDELEGVNRNNSSVLVKTESDLSSVNRLDAKLRSEDQLLYEAVKATRLKVRPFGWFSHFRRLLRFWIKGYYYTQQEFVFVARLDAAVLRFVTAVQDNVALLPPKNGVCRKSPATCWMSRSCTNTDYGRRWRVLCWTSAAD